MKKADKKKALEIMDKFRKEGICDFSNPNSVIQEMRAIDTPLAHALAKDPELYQEIVTAKPGEYDRAPTSSEGTADDASATSSMEAGTSTQSATDAPSVPASEE